MPSSCKDIRAALAECLQNSDCIMVQLNKPGDCLRPPLNKTLPTRCQQLQKGLAQCKRGMIDMRKRFRGNMPVSMQAEQKEVPQQLYAGKPSVDVKPAAPEEEAK